MDYPEPPSHAVREVRNRPKLGSRTMNIREVKTVRCSPGFRDRAGGLWADCRTSSPATTVALTRELPRRKLAAPRQRGCSHQARNLWDPAVMRCRAVSQPSQSRGILETRKISKSVELLLCPGICSAGAPKLYRVDRRSRSVLLSSNGAPCSVRSIAPDMKQ